MFHVGISRCNPSILSLPKKVKKEEKKRRKEKENLLQVRLYWFWKYPNLVVGGGWSSLSFFFLSFGVMVFW